MQSENAYSPNSFNEEGSSSCFSEEHPSKAFFSILDTEEGIEISTKFMQPLNEDGRIEVREVEIIILVNDVHALKTSGFPRSFIELLISIESILLYFSNPLELFERDDRLACIFTTF